MNEKQKLYRARRRAAQILRLSGYRVVPLPDDPIFDIEATRSMEMRKIAVSMSPMTTKDLDRISKVRLPAGCHKELWVKAPKGPDFAIEEIS